MRLAVASATAPQSKVLSTVTGDFNWVVAAGDRLAKAAAAIWPGRRFGGAGRLGDSLEARRLLRAPAARGHPRERT
eukprot:709854-Pyramimonas_sp.AAC.1